MSKYRAFCCQASGSCSSSTCPCTFILTIDLQFEDLNSSHHKWDPFCETIEIVNTSQYSAQRLQRRIFCPTRLDGGCWKDQVMLLGCTGRVRIFLRKYCWLSCFDIVLASKVCRTVKLYNSLQRILSTKNEIKWFWMTEIIFTFGFLSF